MSFPGLLRNKTQRRNNDLEGEASRKAFYWHPSLIFPKNFLSKFSQKEINIVVEFWPGREKDLQEESLSQMI